MNKKKIIGIIFIVLAVLIAVYTIIPKEKRKIKKQRRKQQLKIQRP